MNLKNYTTEVPASRSIDYIERLLVEFGAHNIMKAYTAGRCTSISFIIDVDGQRMPFKLPANVNRVAKWLQGKKPTLKAETIQAQAERIAWRQQHEILHLQLGQIETTQLDRLQVLFGYLYNAERDVTFYEEAKASGFKGMLEAPK